MDPIQVSSTLQSIKVNKVSSDQSTIVGIALVAHPTIVGSAPAMVTDGDDILEVPFRFYAGNLNLVRSELHKMVDDAIEALMS